MLILPAVRDRSRAQELIRAPSRGWLFGLCILLALPVFADSDRSLVVDPDRLLELARLDDEALAKLRAGEVVTLTGVAETKGDSNKFDLYSGLAIIIDTPASTVAAVVARPEWAGAGIPGAVGSPIAEDSVFPTATFSRRDAAEVQRILTGKDEVNLGRAELESLRALNVTEPFESTELSQFSAAYTDLLRARYASYAELGLAGIAPYEDRRDRWAPADHIRLINEYWDTWLPQVLPLYAKQLSLSPGEIDSAVEQEFLLVSKPIGDRVLFSLVHRFGRHTDDLMVMIHREFFVSGAYGAMQIILIGVPYEGDTLLLLGGDAFTEKVAGFGSSMKHKVGRQTMQDVMRGMLFELRAQARNTDK